MCIYQNLIIIELTNDTLGDIRMQFATTEFEGKLNLKQFTKSFMLHSMNE